MAHRVINFRHSVDKSSWKLIKYFLFSLQHSVLGCITSIVGYDIDKLWINFIFSTHVGKRKYFMFMCASTVVWNTKTNFRWEVFWFFSISNYTWDVIQHKKIFGVSTYELKMKFSLSLLINNEIKNLYRQFEEYYQELAIPFSFLKSCFKYSVYLNCKRPT